MRTTRALSITLPRPMAEMVKSKVTSGEYASESEVIRDGLRMLSARDAAVEKWLRDEVVPAYDEAKAHPERLLDADQVRANLAVHIAARGAGKPA
jgi:antitoxin ParD1/3/4